jgi:hypothetical protein
LYNIPYSSTIELSDEFHSLKYIFSNLEKKFISINIINDIFNINFEKSFKNEIAYLLENNIILIKSKNIYFLKEKYSLQIYLSIFFIKLLDVENIQNDIKNISEKQLDLDLLSLTDEI